MSVRRRQTAFIPGWFGTARLMIWIVFAFLLWQAWVFMRPRPRSYSDAELGAVENVYAELIQRVRGSVGINTGRELRIGVAHILNDPSDILTDRLRMALGRQAGWSVEEGSIIQRFLLDVSQAVKDATSIDEVVNAGRRVELDVIVAGRALTINQQGRSAEALMDLRAYDLRSGKWVTEENIHATWSPQSKSTAMAAASGSLQNPLIRFSIWLAVVALLPWVTGFATLWALERNSNAHSFFLLSGYSAIGLGLGLFLVRFQLQDWRGALGAIAVLLFCTCYNYWACERIGADRNV